MQINIKKMSNQAIIPKRMTAGAVGYDLYSAETTVINAWETRVIKTGIAVELPIGVEMQIRPRSGLSVKFNVLTILGTIDSDYRGEIGVIMKNYGDEAFAIGAGDRIAQAVFNRVELPEMLEVEELSDTMRGSGGFGSTDKKLIKSQASELEFLVKQVMKND